MTDWDSMPPIITDEETTTSVTNELTGKIYEVPAGKRWLLIGWHSRHAAGGPQATATVFQSANVGFADSTKSFQVTYSFENDLAVGESTGTRGNPGWANLLTLVNQRMFSPTEINAGGTLLIDWAASAADESIITGIIYKEVSV